MYEKPQLVVVGSVGQVVLGGGDDWSEGTSNTLAVEGIPLGLDD